MHVLSLLSSPFQAKYKESYQSSSLPSCSLSLSLERTVGELQQKRLCIQGHG